MRKGSRRPRLYSLVDHVDKKVLLLQVRMQFHFINRWSNARFGKEYFQLGPSHVGRADILHQAFINKGFYFPPGTNKVFRFESGYLHQYFQPLAVVEPSLIPPLCH